MQVNSVLQELCMAAGVGGMTDAAACAADLLRPYCDNVECDALGNVVAWRKGKRDGLPTVMLEAHIDEIGFVVTGVDDRGFVKVANCGGVDNRVLTASEVTVYGDRPYAGLFCSVPPHLGGGDLPAVTDRGIDVGMTAEQVREHIPVGSPVSFRKVYKPLLATRVCAASLDDRAGVAAVLYCLSLLENEQLPVNVAVLFSVQEELGMRGAGAATFAIDPQVSVSVDVSFAASPLENGTITTKLSKGPMVGMSPSLNVDISRKMAELAKTHDIPFQYEGMGGSTGTNADRIGVTRGGVKTALLSVPLRYMHTPVEVADLTDIENTARLMAVFVKEGSVEVC
ncbi:MAG: M20/M25/M40 family metallo-hydrolase [Ruminococcaceae bacterium]|nr:M20/M25/M40 family metallo-hydrolase [Oscillospiraceae bacterium]